MSEDGHPIVGDKKYGAKTNNLGRLALHASKLELIDPRNGQYLKFSSKIPDEFSQFAKTNNLC